MAITARLAATRGGRREASQVDPVRHEQLSAGVPARAVPDAHHPMRGIDPLVLGEGGQGGADRCRRDRRQQAPPTLARRRPNQAVNPQPLVLAVARRDRPLPEGSPDAPLEGDQAEPVFVLSPDRDDFPRMRCPDRIDGFSEPPF